MDTEKDSVKYPENLFLKSEVLKSGKSVTELAETIGFSRLIVSQTINGRYKGTNVVPALKKELGII